MIIYNPPVYAGVSFSVLAVLLSFFLLFKEKNIFVSLIRIKPIHNLLILFTVFFTYYLFISIENYLISSNKNILTNLTENIVSFTSFFLVGFSVVVWAISKKITFNKLCKLYIEAGLLQTIIVIACLISPAIKSFFNALTVENSNSAKITRGFEFEAAYRNFGFASTLYDIFGFAMAILGVMAYCQALKGKKLFYIVSMAFAIAAGVNARSAFIIYLVGIILIILSPKGKVRLDWLIRVVIYLTIGIIGIYYLFAWIVSDTSSEQLIWLASAITESQSFSGGESEGYYDALINNFIVFPEGLSLIFGTGMPPHLAINHNSDVGYIQNIWQYGIIGSALLYAFYINMFRMAIRRVNWPDSIMLRTILIMIGIYLVKLTCFGYSQASLIFGPICMLATYYGFIERKN